MFDVVEVEISTAKVRIVDRNKDSLNADAIIKLAVMRRGVDNHFFVSVRTGKYKDGDEYIGPGTY